MKDKRTYTTHKEHAEDISHENETLKDFTNNKVEIKEKEQLRLELNQVKIQRDIVLKKLNKVLTIAKQLRTLIEL
jgi:hypothetical protein